MTDRPLTNPPTLPASTEEPPNDSSPAATPPAIAEQPQRDAPLFRLPGAVVRGHVIVAVKVLHN
jgi:hypothetical protein